MKRNTFFIRIGFVTLATVIGVILWRYTHEANSDDVPQHVKFLPPADVPKKRDNPAAHQDPNQDHHLLDAQRLQEQELIAQLAAPDQRIVQFPKWVRSVEIASDGKPIFYGRDDDSGLVETLQDSAVRFASGASRVICHGQLLLDDRQERLWLKSQDSSASLYCLDHGKWRVCSATGFSDPANHLERKGYLGAWEDEQGNCWLLSLNSASLIMQRLAADGTWSEQRLADAKDPRITCLRINPALTKQQFGLMTIKGEVQSSSSDEGVLCYDGNQWSVQLPKGCRQASHEVTQIIPLLNGSILTVCSQGRVWTYWPPGAAAHNSEFIDRWIRQLDDPSFSVRREALERITLAGECAKSQLLAAQTAASPEAASDIQELLNGFSTVAQDAAADGHDRSRPYAGRYQYWSAKVCATGWKGKAILLLTNFHDLKNAEKVGAENGTSAIQNGRDRFAMAVVQPDGMWEIHPLNDEKLQEAGWRVPPDKLFVDSNSQLWAHQRLFMKSDLSLVTENTSQRLPLGMTGMDREGVIYLQSAQAGVIAYKPYASQSSDTELSYKSYAVESVKVVPGGHAAIDIEFHPTTAPATRSEAFRLDRDKTSFTTVDRQNEAIDPENLVILKKDWMISSFSQVNPPPQIIGGAIFNGKRWHFGSNTLNMVRQNPQSLASVAPQQWGPNETSKIGGDGKCIWCVNTSNEPQPDAPQFGVDSYDCHRFWHYDGNKWHDVWADLNIAEGKPIAKPPNDGKHSAPSEGYPGHREPMILFNKGTEVLVSDGPQLPLALHYENGKLVSKRLTTQGDLMVPLPGPLPPPVADMPIEGDAAVAMESALNEQLREGADGELWGSVKSKSQIVCIRNDLAMIDSQQGSVLHVDSRNRIWISTIDAATNQRSLLVKMGNRWVPATLSKGEFAGKIVEAVDGRMLYLSFSGIGELKVDDTAGTVTEFVRWNWPLPPAGGRCPNFIDSSDGLWYQTSQTTMTRFQLPTVQSTTRPDSMIR